MDRIGTLEPIMGVNLDLDAFYIPLQQVSSDLVNQINYSLILNQ
jgi:hypothetical protein